MIINPESLAFLCIVFFIIAMIYTSVGFGGGSSYLAVLALFITDFFTIRSLALACNILAVSNNSFLYFKNKHLKLKECLPFIITSIPMAYLGASFRLKESLFFIILGVALVTSSVFLIWSTLKKATTFRSYPGYLSYILGIGIGFISGLAGIGGGIFLAPILHHLHWSNAVKIAALSSVFILVNSLSGFSGLLIHDMLRLPWLETLLLMIAVLTGGYIGIRFSLKNISAKGLKQITAVLVFSIGIRILLVNGLAWF